MKNAVKKALGAMWGLTACIRRPLKRKLHAFIVEVCAPVRAGWDVQHEQHLVLNSLVRELTRLQDQIDVLQQMVAELAGARGLESVDSPRSKAG